MEHTSHIPSISKVVLLPVIIPPFFLNLATVHK
ncbi:hypothetical protein [Citrobacter phage Tr1]|nr:hypothetical protein [Citrobacter phage Tr1]